MQQVIVRESEAGGAGEPGAAVTGTATVQQQKPQKAAPEESFRRSWQAGVPSWVRLPELFKQSLQRAVPRVITQKQEIPSFMWNSRIFWG